MITIITFLLSFFNPSIKLSSGKSITLLGNGSPVLFSSGLFGTMPSFLYNKFLDDIKKEFTIVNINDITPITQKDINDVTKSLSVDYISYISHSSFNPDILESTKINKAILFDPICIPNLNFNGVNQQNIDAKFPILIIKADKLYNSDPTIPDWQTPNINGNVTEIFYKNVGHPDILDDFWANFAKSYGFWDTSDGKIQKFSDWKLKRNDVKDERKKYRKFLSKKAIEFINN